MAKAKTKQPATVALEPKVSTAGHTVPRSVQLTMLLAVVLGLLFVSPYFGTIMFSALIAFIFFPVYKYTLAKTKRQTIALTATIVVAILSFLLPLFIIVTVTIGQVNTLVAQLQDENTSVSTAEIDNVLDRGTERVTNLITALPGGENLNINKEQVQNAVQQLLADIAQGLLNFIKNAGGAVAGLVSTLILGFFLIIGMLRYQAELISFLKKLSPFHESVNELYFNQAGSMTKAMVKGQLIIATAQGFASAASLWLVGIDFFWFFFMLLTFMSFIPLGAGIITIPIGIIIMLSGNIGQGLFVILFHIFGVSFIDNILRPQLVPKSARLNSALTLLAVFSGLAIFGAPGVIYGPVIMILLLTTFRMYAAHNSQSDKPKPLMPA